MAVSYVDRQALAAIAPTVCSALAISDRAYGWLQAAFSWAYLVGPPVAGRLVDRLGPRRCLLWAVVIWSLVAAGHSVVPGFWSLFLFRIGLGLAESPSFPGAAQTINRALPPEDRSTAFGLVFTGSTLGAAVAPLIAVTLATQFGWRSAFWGTALVGLTWIPLWLAVSGSAAAREKLDAPSASAAVPVISPWRMALDPAVLRAVFVVLAAAPTAAAALLWGSKFLVTTFGLGQAELRPYLVVTPLAFDLGSVGFGAIAGLIERRRRKKGRKIDAPHRGPMLAAAILSLVVAAAPRVGSPVTATALLGIGLIGVGGLFALLTADLMARVPKEHASLGAGIAAMAQSIAYVISSPILGEVVMRTGSYAPAFAGLAIWIVPGTAAWLLWTPSKTSRTGRAT